MSPRGLLPPLLLAAAGCAPAPPSPPPPPPPPAASSAAAPPAEPPAPPPPAAGPSFKPRPPFVVVAEAGADEAFAVLPLAGSQALVAVAASGGATARLLKTMGASVSPAPELLAGLPLGSASDKAALALASGALGGPLWVAVDPQPGASPAAPCRVFEWSTDRFVERPIRPPSAGSCAALTTWTRGAALLVMASDGLTLHAAGDAPKIPSMGAPPRSHPHCAGTIASVQGFHTNASGVVFLAGVSCDNLSVRVDAWPPGATSPVTLTLALDGNSPNQVELSLGGDLLVVAPGSLPGKSDPEMVEARVRLAGGRLREVGRRARANDWERWMLTGAEAVGGGDKSAPDRFEIESYRKTPAGEVYLAGRLFADGKPARALLLRGR